jgi:mannose-6-phosphate isomerase-like protein (cupin superfamily)
MVMSDLRLRRRSFLQTLLAIPVGLITGQQNAQPSGAGIKVAAGADRFDDVRKLPGGDLLFVKVATQDTAGAFFLTEQPISRRWAGPPKHFHREQDEWFYCIAGEYVVEVGNQRFTLDPGDSVLGPRMVPHAFAFVGNTSGKLLVGFTPAGKMEEFFREIEKRGRYFGQGTAEDKERARQYYGIENVGPPLTP